MRELIHTQIRHKYLILDQSLIKHSIDNEYFIKAIKHEVHPNLNSNSLTPRSTKITKGDLIHREERPGKGSEKGKDLFPVIWLGW